MNFKLNWGNSIFLFFVGFLALAFYFIYFSFQHKNDLVVKDYYEQGANYSDKMEVIARSIPFENAITVSQKSGVVSVLVAPIIRKNTSEITAYFYRASDKKSDIKQTFAANDSILNLNMEDFKKGRYDLTVSWNMGEEQFEVKKQISIKK